MIADCSQVAKPRTSFENLPVDAPIPNHLPNVLPNIPGFPPDRCAAYLAGTEGSPPRAQLLAAIRAVRTRAPQTMDVGEPVRIALDVGCGPGREVVALRAAGFEVDAIDPYPEMIERTRESLRVASFDVDRGLLVIATLEEFASRLLPERYDLIHAGFVLPFVRPASFDHCWALLVASLAPGGVFAGQFFGPNDDFIRDAASGAMTSHTSDSIDALFRDWEMIEREEVDRDGAIGRGAPKHWHVHHVIARKKPRGSPKETLREP